MQGGCDFSERFSLQMKKFHRFTLSIRQRGDPDLNGPHQLVLSSPAAGSVSVGREALEQFDRGVVATSLARSFPFGSFHHSLIGSMGVANLMVHDRQQPIEKRLRSLMLELVHVLDGSDETLLHKIIDINPFLHLFRKPPVYMPGHGFVMVDQQVSHGYLVAGDRRDDTFLLVT